MSNTELDVAIARLTAWSRKLDPAKRPELLGDLSLVLIAAIDYRRLTAEKQVDTDGPNPAE